MRLLKRILARRSQNFHWRLKDLRSLRNDLNVNLLSYFLLVEDINAQLIFVFFNRKRFKDAVEELFFIRKDIVRRVHNAKGFKSLTCCINMRIFAPILDVALVARLHTSHVLNLDGKFERVDEAYWSSREFESIFGNNYKSFIWSKSSAVEI